MSEQRDAISSTIHIELLEWLRDTNATARSVEDTSDLVAGAIAGLCQFMWEIRSPGVGKRGVLRGLTEGAASMLAQFPDEHEVAQ